MRFPTFIFITLFAFALPAALMGGGVILYEIATADTRLASAGWAARAEDPSTLFTNPAGMTRLCGTQLEIGAQPIFAHLNFDKQKGTEVSGPNGHANKWLPSGSSFLVKQTCDQLWLGVGTVGYFGSDLVFNSNWVGRYYVQKILLQAASLVPAAAYRINEQWSVGAGANVMYGFFKQQSAINNVLDGLPDGFFRCHAYRWGCGGVFGILYEPTACTRIGIQYLTPVKIAFKTKPRFHGVGPLLNYIITTTGLKNSTIDLGIRVPQCVMLSAYHALNPCWSIMGNVGWQEWSRFQKVSLSLANTNQTTLSSKVQYLDTWHVAGGIEWHPCDTLTFSTGIAYDSSAVNTKNRALDFPVGKQWRVGGGARWSKQNLTLDFSMEVQWQEKMKIDVSRGPNAGHIVGNFKNFYVVFTCLDVIWAF